MYLLIRDSTIFKSNTVEDANHLMILVKIDCTRAIFCREYFLWGNVFTPFTMRWCRNIRRSACKMRNCWLQSHRITSAEGFIMLQQRIWDSCIQEKSLSCFLLKSSFTVLQLLKGTKLGEWGGLGFSRLGESWEKNGKRRMRGRWVRWGEKRGNEEFWGG